ncbi:hypothetical protein TVAG_112870 [Trichomonas vaginalis G3]|uniref:Uncharacterized protein n=1 Tax=Trichomonas vaginalis (strain ATCC PRA-98 / G3) TaxID=412133 RepID=A2F734_TRIV3|nr:hypothetical protein TVAGG3_0258580 [Trichomonas vaginalis G3]EAX99271.1 hypothetical protein TVAG_112870 [Trichomonas vaginalis G3]KAI5524937.1 hypothetical protein TVAGG3_0258580 [Trichomonas vaginalis G3]|eukprot:XP_001312201.1 hypothetical protein [Trichomonas vaginalis G3]
MLNDDENLSGDELVSLVCSKSLDIQDLIQKHDPSAVQEFQIFYDQAIKALDLQTANLSSLEKESITYHDSYNNSAKSLKSLKDKVKSLNQEKMQLNDTIDILTYENNILEEQCKGLFDKEDSTDYESLIKSAQNMIDELEQKDKELDEELAIENNKNTNDLAKEIPNLKKQIEDLEDGLAVKMKKNQRRAKEIEVRIKKFDSQNNTDQKQETVDDSDEENDGPSTIIHRTSASIQEQIRDVRASLERALKQNGALKTNLKDLLTDLDAMHEENFQLKGLVDKVQKRGKQ